MSLDEWQVQVGDWLGGPGTAYILSAFDHAKPDLSSTAGDQPLPGEDGLVFGRDTLGGTLITIEGAIVTPGDGAAALDAMAVWRAAWQADDIRATPGAVTTLRYRMPGREDRFVFGRPRQFTPSSLANTVSGLIPVTCDWQCADHRWYGEEQVVTLGTMPDTTGGITWPITWPITWAGEASGGDRILNDGDSATWPIITFRGPVATPGVSWGGNSLSVGTTLTTGQAVTVDTRPWVRTVLRESGGSVAGLLRGNRLGEMSLAPGLTEVLFSGTDGTGTAQCEIRWRSASSSP